MILLKSVVGVNILQENQSMFVISAYMFISSQTCVASDCVVFGILCLSSLSCDTCLCPILCLYQGETRATGILLPLCASAFCKRHRSEGFYGAPSQGLKQPDAPEYKLTLSLDSDSNLPVWSALQSGIGLPMHSDCQERHSKCKLFFYPNSQGQGVGNINRILIIF